MSDDTNNTHVIVMDFRMPFSSMVTFMIKWALAAIPAMIILSIIFAAVAALVSLLLTGGVVGLQKILSH